MKVDIKKVKESDDTNGARIIKFLVNNEVVKVPKEGWDCVAIHLVDIAAEQKYNFKYIKNMFLPLVIQKDYPDTANSWKYSEKAKVYVCVRNPDDTLTAIGKIKDVLGISVRLEFELQNGVMRYI